jgi:PUA domain protein
MVDAEKGEIVVLNAEGKQHAMSIGLLEKSSKQIQEENSGIAIESLNFMGDDLWRMRELKK